MFRLLITARSFGISNPDIFSQIDKINKVEYLRPDHTGAFNEREMIDLSKDVDGIVVGTDKITNSVIENAIKLKIILKHGVGVDNIDIPSATKAGIMVTNMPGVNDASVAEMVFAFILSYSRGIIDLFLNAQRREWNKYITHDINGKTLGVIGTGRIGREVIKRAIAFGMHILANDVIRNPEVENNPNVQYTSMDNLLRDSDIITLHVPLTEQTKGLIGLNEIEKMKDSVFLVNTSRPGILDEKVAIAAVREKMVGGVAIDVLGKYPPDYDYLDLGSRAILTPHVASYTYEVLELMDRMIIDAIKEFISKGMPTSVNILNKVK